MTPAARTFTVSGVSIAALRDGSWWLVGRPGGRVYATDEARLGALLCERLESDPADPYSTAALLTAELLAAKATVPQRARVGPDGRPATEVAAIDWLVEAVPELRPLLEAHVAYMDELLAYVVFEGDFTRWFVGRVAAGDEAAARRFCDAVESLLTTASQPPADDPVWNLAGVCFTEALVMGGERATLAAAASWFGPATAGNIEQMQR